MERLEQYLNEGTKPEAILGAQPRSLFSTGPQIDRDVVVQSESITRGVARK